MLHHAVTTTAKTARQRRAQAERHKRACVHHSNIKAEFSVPFCHMKNISAPASETDGRAVGCYSTSAPLRQVSVLHELDVVRSCGVILLRLEVVGGETKVAENRVSQILQLAHHFVLHLLPLALHRRAQPRHGRCGPCMPHLELVRHLFIVCQRSLEVARSLARRAPSQVRLDVRCVGGDGGGAVRHRLFEPFHAQITGGAVRVTNGSDTVGPATAAAATAVGHSHCRRWSILGWCGPRGWI
mmetsp:Transcript_14902/g.36578  ORF Transcript_14902/g.36578 Transcript_14902/m.36578 type:complete len:242 (-) Transcript_14902:30-755(-)